MKTIKEKLDDLTLKLKEAKTLEEAQAVTKEIETIQADAEKVVSALGKANKEAKEHRESKEELEKKLTKLQEETKSKEEPKKDPEKNEELEKLQDSIKQLQDKLKEKEDAEKQKQTKNDLLSRLDKKLEKIPEKQRGFFKSHITVDDLDPENEELDKLLDDKVNAFQKEVNDLSIANTGKPYFPREGDAEGRAGEEIAKMRNGKTEGSTGSLKAVTLPGMKD